MEMTERGREIIQNIIQHASTVKELISLTYGVELSTLSSITKALNLCSVFYAHVAHGNTEKQLLRGGGG